MSVWNWVLSCRLNWLAGVALFVCIQPVFLQKALAQGQARPPETIYNTDWNERLSPNLGLTAHDHNLLGDSIDLHTGRLSFEHVDVSIPGNSDLPVEIRRRRNPSQSYNNEFADWQLVAPTISTKIMSYEFGNGQRWGKRRCSDPLVSTIPPSAYAQAYFHAEGSPVPPSQYSDGVLLDVPGRASGQLLDKTVAASWPAAAKKVTADGWYFTCILNIDGSGTEGFYGYAPNGERYRFDIKRSRNAVAKNDIWYITYTTLGASVLYANEAPYYDVLAASEVTDVHGNWVRYVYDSQGKLTRIHSNDGRQIDLTYTSSTPYRVTGVVAHSGSADERRWTYEYTNQTFTRYMPPSQANGVPSIGTGYSIALTKVNLPNGRSWQFQLAGLFAEAVPGDTYRALPNNNPQVYCKQVDQVVSITHPDGIVGQFELKEFKRLHPVAAQSQYGPPCPKSSIGRGLNYYADFMAVTKKTLSANSVTTAVWQYNYLNPADLYAGQTGANRSVVTWPDGSVRVNHYNPTSSGSNPFILKEQVYANASVTSPIQMTDYVYLLESNAGSTFLSQTVTAEVYRPLHQQEVTLTRGSDWYKTRYTYITDRTFANYSYGFPTQIDQWSSLGGGTRTTNYAYLKNADDWILGLVDTVTKNGTLFDDYDYDAKGRLTAHKRFGVTVAALGYHTAGVQAGRLNWYKDALNRQTTFADYYRAAPRTITHADGTVVTYALDSNGWVTRHTNARGHATQYQYDSVGRLILVDRPSPWSDTGFEYSYSNGTLVQTAVRGMEQTNTVYDAMLRPIRVEREDFNAGGAIIYTKTTYDVMGRVNFASLPSYSLFFVGTETSYDALGRMTQTRETAAGGGTTFYAYLSGNRTQVTDPMGNVTITTASGYGDPGDGKTIKTQKPEGVTADFNYDIYGKLLSIVQARSDGATHSSSFVYDARHRLCRRKIPETGDTLYAYNNADEMTAYTEGQASGTTCAAPPAGLGVALSYDLQGRLVTTDYPGATPDIARSYDSNGNLLTISRGGINWSYAYNSIDLIEEETLSLDGRSYGIDYGYDGDGQLTSKIYPSGQQYLYTNDGFGRPTRIRSGAAYYLDSISYHPNGKIHLLTRGNGGLYEQLLNARQLPSHIGGNWGDDLNYTYDANGRVIQINAVTYNAYDRSFGYDGVGRLVSATGSWGAASFSYDALGNLKRKQLGSRIVDIEYNNSLNRVLRARDSTAGNIWRNYSHDARGNVTADGRHNFTYDFSNQPVALSGTNSGTYSYDGHLRRVKQVVGGETIYSIYDKSGALLTRDNASTGVKTDYVTLAGQTFIRIRNGIASYPLNDHLGTALMEADQNSAVAPSKAYNYTPFGENIAPPFGNAGNDPGSVNEQGYAGHIEDATGLTYMQARYYDPVIGRFLSPDPIGYEDQLNLYSYVHNDPVNNIDPIGKDTVSLGLSFKLLGTGISTGGQFTFPGSTKEPFDIGIYGSFTPGSAGELIISALNSEHPLADSSAGIDFAKITVDIGYDTMPQEESSFLGVEMFAGAPAPYVGGIGGTATFDANQTDSIPTGGQINIGPQFRAGANLEVKGDLTVRDVVEVVVDVVEDVKDMYGSPH